MSKDSPRIMTDCKQLKGETLGNNNEDPYCLETYDDMFGERCQVLAKLGYGEYFTMRLDKDLTGPSCTLISLVHIVLDTR